MSAKRTEPTHSLFDPDKAKQHAYTHSSSTDLKARFAAMKLEALRARQSPNVAQIGRKKS